jgi:hypothetical protein
MIYDWSDFLKYSGFLFNNFNETSLLSANYRSIISRSYYSVFNKCLNYQKSRTGRDIKKDRHNVTIKEFKEYPDAKHQKLGIELGR